MESKKPVVPIISALSSDSTTISRLFNIGNDH